MNNKPYGHRIIVSPSSNDVSVVGVDYETRNISVLARNKDAIVLKVPGRTVWSGNYVQRRYVPPAILVYTIKKSVKSIVKNGEEIIEVEPLIEWDHARKKKEETS